MATLLALGVAAVAAGTASGAGQSRSARQDVVTLTFWNGFTGPDRPALEKVVKAFNASHPDIRVQMTIMPWDVFFQKLLPAYAAGKGPVIAAMDTAQLPQYDQKHVFQPLDDLYKDPEFPAKKLVPAAVNATMFEGKHYAIPMNFTTLLLYWNKTMFQKAGISGPPKNWQEWARDAVKLTKDTNSDGRPEQYGLAIADHDTIAMWPILLWSAGGGVVSKDGKESMLDHPSTIKAVKFWSNLIINKHISPVGLAGADADKLFQSKKAAMEMVGPWMTTGFRQAGIKFGLSMIPRGPERQVTLGTSVAMALSSRASDDEKKAAYEFFKYWESPQAQITFSTGSGFPPTRTDIPASKLRSNPYVGAFARYAKQSQFYLPGIVNYAKIDGDIFSPAIQRILNKKGSPESILRGASKQVDQALSS